MRFIHRLTAFALLGQLSLGGGAFACEVSEQPRPASVQLTDEPHSAHLAAGDEQMQHPANDSCEHAAVASGCVAMTVCSVAVVSARAAISTTRPLPHHPINGQLLRRAERSEEPELPPPRI